MQSKPVFEVMKGDSLELLPTFKDGEFDYFLTSPPFYEEEFHHYEYWKNLDAIIEELRRITSKAGFMFQSSTKMKWMLARYPDIHRVLIWAKVPSNVSFRYEPILVWQFGDFKVNKYIFKDVWVIPAVNNGNGGRMGAKDYENPVRLYKQILQMLPKGRVIDPFLGTGTTLKACRLLGHSCTGIEIDGTKPCFNKSTLEAYA